MPFHDLNVAYTSDHIALSNTLLFAKELGYETVALAIAITGNLPTKLPSIPVSTLTKPDVLRVLTRITLTISDNTQNHRLSALSPSYDLIAVRPTNEKCLQHCCLSLECDIISIDFSQRLPFVLKFKTVASALQRGVRFEICYSPGVISGNDARRNLISGATQLIRATRGRGIMISSEARTALGLRGPWDVINLAQVWGLPQQRAKEALCEEAGKLVRFAAIKRTSFRGVVDIIDSGAILQDQKQERVRNNKQTNDILSTAQRQNADVVAANETKTRAASGSKRKASLSSLNAPPPAMPADDKPLSKNEKKRRAKKARLEGKSASSIDTADRHKPLLLQHESLVSSKPI